MERTSLRYECMAEFIGTYILVFFGVGSVHTAVLLGGQQGIWQVGVVWAVAISLAIYAVGAVSGAHINPAITVSFAIFRKFPNRKIPFYVVAQVLGAFAAAATLYGLFHNVIAAFELENGIVRGAAGSELSAMVYGEYYPNPAMLGSKFREFAGATVTHTQAMFAEGIGTAFLAFFVHAVTDVRNPERPHSGLFAPFIGLTVAIVISIVAPLTQAGLNPARDFGPRLFALCAGWGPIALPGPRESYSFFTVYILAPIMGAIVGAAIYDLVVRQGIIFVNEAEDDKPLREEEHT